MESASGPKEMDKMTTYSHAHIAFSTTWRAHHRHGTGNPSPEPTTYKGAAPCIVRCTQDET